MVEAKGQEAADETMSAMTNTSMEPMLPEQRPGHQGALTASGFLPDKVLRWQWTEGVMSFFLKKAETSSRSWLLGTETMEQKSDKSEQEQQ